jgi:hypothetical protein
MAASLRAAGAAAAAAGVFDVGAIISGSSGGGGGSHRTLLASDFAANASGNGSTPADGKFLTADQISLVTALSELVSALSLAGSLFITVAFLYFKRLRSFSFMLVATLSLTDFVGQVLDFVQPPSVELEAMDRGAPLTAACWVQALSDSFFQLASVLWTTAIAATLYMSVFLRMPADVVERKYKWFALACYGVPAVLTLLPLSDAAYGPAGGWCWIRGNKDYWRYIQFYAPLWLAIIFNAVVYTRVVMLLRRTMAAAKQVSAGMGGGSDDEAVHTMHAILRRLQVYPFILLVVWLPASVNRLYESATGQQVFGLYLAQKMCSNSQGMLNALAYGLSAGVREALWDVLQAKCPPAVLAVLCCCGCKCCGRGDSSQQARLMRGSGKGGGRGALAVGDANVSLTRGALASGRSAAAARDDAHLNDDDHSVDEDDVVVMPGAAPPGSAAAALSPAGLAYPGSPMSGAPTGGAAAAAAAAAGGVPAGGGGGGAVVVGNPFANALSVQERAARVQQARGAR